MSLKVSLITACKNNAATIEACLKSVQEQTSPLEHIVIDGGSTDGSLDIIESHKRGLSAFVSEPDFGIYDALNKGIVRATGDVIGVLHADDCFADNHVVADIAAAFSDVSAAALYGDLEYVGKHDGRKVKRYWVAGSFNERKFYRGWMPPHPTFFSRRENFEKFGKYRLDLGTSADYELMLRYLLVQKLKAIYLPRVLVRMRMGGSSNSSWNARLKASQMDRRAWEVNGLSPRFWTLIAKPLRKLGQWSLL